MNQTVEIPHVLVVEDSRTQAERLKLVLEENGFCVNLAPDGAEALSAIARQRPDLVLSDVLMPRMNGYQMCRAIKSDRRLRDLPVLLLTTLGDPEEVLEGLESGADYYITKPCDDGLLVDRIRKLLSGGPRRVRDDIEVLPPLEVELPGGTRTVHSSRRRMLDVLLSTYENTVRQNQELTAVREALERLNESLLQEVTERRRAEAEVRQLNDRLRQSNEELEQFAYVACHDLKQPLNQIAMLTDILVNSFEGRLSDSQIRLTGMVRKGVDRMRALILDLLELSRVESKGKPMEPVALGEVLTTVLETVRNELAASGGEVAAGPLPTVTGDRGQLVQLVQNLIGNAIKFRRQGVPPRVLVDAVREKGSWLISVSDNGTGFDPDKAEEVFQMFRRLHSHDEYPGTGIGLAICAKIVGRHGGRIWAESRPGVGSVFHFTLPST
jgi:signal transduction histidine kinase